MQKLGRVSNFTDYSYIKNKTFRVSAVLYSKEIFHSPDETPSHFYKLTGALQRS